MLELEPKFSKKLEIIASDASPACPVNHENLYKHLVESVAWNVDHQLVLEEYYLSEQDCDWYSQKEIQRRFRKINELRKMTPEQREREIHAKVMAEIFKENLWGIPRQGEIFDASRETTRKEAA